MATKKVQLEFDIDSKDVKIVGGELLSLTQQLRVFKKEIQDPNLSQQNFEILRKKIGDVEDGIARTTTKSRDFFSVLSTLPGPIGSISSSLSGAIDTLKVFSSFSLKDIKNSFTDIIDDIGDVIKNFLGLNNATKAQTAATSAQTTATNAATVATEGQAVATNVLTTAEKQATIASKALRLALTALGIGAVIFLLTELIPLITEWITGTKAAEAEQKRLNDRLEEQKRILKETEQAISDKTKLALIEAKKEGKSEAELSKIRLDGFNQQIQLSKETKEKLLKDNEDLLKNTKLTKKQIVEETEKNNKLIEESDQKLLTNQQAIREETANEELRVIEERRQKQKEIADKRIQLLQQQNAQIEQDTKAANERLLKLEQEFDVLTATNEDEANRIRLKQAYDQEVKEINALKLKNQKINGIVVTAEQTRQRLLQQAQKNFQIKTDNLEIAQIENAIQSYKSFNDRIQQIKSDAQDDEYEKRRIKAEQNAKKEKEDLQKQTEDLIKIQSAMKVTLPEETELIEKNIQSIKDASAAAQILIEKNKAVEIAKINVEEGDDKIQKLEETNAKLNEKQQKQLDNELRILELRNQVLGEGTAEYFKNREEILSKAYLKERLLEINNYDLLIAKAAGNAEEQEKLEQQKADALIAIKEKYVKDTENLFNQEVEAYGRSVSQTIDAIGGLTSAIASSYDEEAKTSEAAFEKRKKLQIATATMSAASGIVQILTQPSTLPSPIDFIVKGINAAALAVSTGIQIETIKKTTFNAEGGKREGLRQGYAEGGLIGGKRHSQGGTIIEAERGEAIMTRGAVTMFAPMLSMMNQIGGGVPFSTNLTTARPDNPLVSNPSQEQQPLILKTYVVENELTSTQQKQARLKDLSTL
jgi:hypothetical protein